MAKRKQSGFSAELQQQMLSLTTDSPLLAVGTVQKRSKMRGKNDKGEWEMFTIEVRGQDGRIVNIVINDPANVPPTGEFIVMPVYVTNTGRLREARQLAEETF